MPTEEQRKERMQEILQSLKSKGGKAKFKVVYGELALKYGITVRTFWDYLAALEAAGKIKYPPPIYLTPVGETFPNEEIVLLPEAKAKA